MNVHIANTDVEFELSHPSMRTIEAAWSRHPLCLQLQFLPLLYAPSDDWVAVTTLPSSDYLKSLEQIGVWKHDLPRLILLQEIAPFHRGHCISWGPSRHVEAWAKARQMSYDIPQDWEVVRLVNSKVFSFHYSELPEAALIHHEGELHHWLNSFEGPKVLKTCFGLSGNGNRLLENNLVTPDLLNFCNKEWQHKRPLIAEPWLERTCDFSTQWMIHQNREIDFVGTTKFETDSLGTYQGTLAGPEEQLFDNPSYLQQHKNKALMALQDIASMGFFGPVGVDALLYRSVKTGSIKLYPIVEINGRQTMSLVALKIQQKYCPCHTLRLDFNKKSTTLPSLLPSHLMDSKGKQIDFHHRLAVSLI